MSENDEDLFEAIKSEGGDDSGGRQCVELFRAFALIRV